MVTSHDEFVRAVAKIHNALTGSTQGGRYLDKLVCTIYYLLGWLVGDAGKHFGSERSMSARIYLELTRKHPENLALGEYVNQCVRNLGIPCRRLPDSTPKRTNPSGSFVWESHYTPVVGWFHVACLGLKWNERTTRNPVRMKWLFGAPNKYRIWFLRGLADSDGDVHFKDKCVDITTLPNTTVVHALLRSLGIRTRIGFSRGYGYVVVSAVEAARIRIFNPNVLTHRRKMLEKLVSAKTFRKPWPSWLESKVGRLLRSGLTIREICEKVLREDNTYVKMNTLKRKRRQLLLERASGGTRSRDPGLTKAVL